MSFSPARSALWIVAGGVLITAGCTSPDAFYRNPIGSGNDAGGVDQSIGGGSGGAGGGVIGSGGKTGAGGGGGTVAGTGGRTGSGGAGGKPPPGQLFLDTFEDGDATEPAPLYTWAMLPDDNIGSWSVVTDGTTKVYKQATSASTESIRVSGDFVWTDQILEAKVKILTSSSSSYKVTLYTRYQDAKNFYIGELTTSGLKVRVRTDGGTTDQARYKFPSGTTLSLNAWHTIRIQVVGSTVTGYLDDQLTAAEVMPPPAVVPPSGGIALGTVNCTAEFDDVKVSSP